MNNPYTYIIVCPNWKLYYGYRYANKVSPEEDLWKHYFSSSDPVKELRKQYDDALFVATVDKIFETDDEARAYEDEFLTENGCVKSDFWLNRAVYPKEFHGPEHHTEETKKKMSIALTGRKFSDAHRKNISIATTGSKHPMYGKKRTEETKKKMSISNMGSKNSMYGKTGSKHPMYGKKHSEETKKRMRKPKSEETIKKMSISNMGSKNSMYGKKHSEEARKKMSIARKGKPKSEETIKKRTETRRKKRLEDPNYGIRGPAPKKTNSVYDKV